MPRDGSQNYAVPGGTDGVADTPVLSTPYNAFLRDLEHDLNTPRPIPHGGTGATNVRDAAIALSSELAVQLVDNYNSFPLIPGSFYSVAGATAAPEASKDYSGICYKHADGRMFLIATAHGSGDATTPARIYIREKSATAWGDWLPIDKRAADTAAELAAAKVAKVGDIMSGPLTISYLADARNGGIVFGNTNHYLYLDGATTPATPTFSLNAPLTVGGRLNAADSVVGTAFATGNMYVGYGAAKGGTIYFGTDGAQYIQHNGTARFNAPGEMDHGVNAVFASQFIASSGVVRFSREGAGEISGGKYLYFNGTDYMLTPGSLSVGGIVTTNLTMPYAGTVFINQLAGSLFQESGGSVTLYSHPGAGYDPFISYHRAGGGFAANMGLMNTNRFGFGGWSHGYSNQYMFWSSADFSNPLIQTRLVYIGDTDHGYSSALNEPSVGAVCTGLSGPSVYNAFTGRYRALQVRTGSGYYATETAG